MRALVRQSQRLTTALHLGWGILILMVVQSIIGVLHPEVYRDNLFVRSAWFGNDLVTLFLVTPIMLMSHHDARRGSVPAILVWIGTLAYSWYNYSFYLFGSALNSLFLVFVALFSLSAYALVLALSGLERSRLEGLDLSARNYRGVSIYMMLWGGFLAALWIGQTLQFSINNKTPAIVLATGHPTNITAALDLAMMVPAVLIGAGLLWRRNWWGLVIALVMNVKGALYALVLAVSSYIAAGVGIPGVFSQIPLWLLLSAASALCCGVLLVKLPRQRL